MAIGHVITVAITDVNRVRICCAVYDGLSEVSLVDISQR